MDGAGGGVEVCQSRSEVLLMHKVQLAAGLEGDTEAISKVGLCWCVLSTILQVCKAVPVGLTVHWCCAHCAHQLGPQFRQLVVERQPSKMGTCYCQLKHDGHCCW